MVFLGFESCWAFELLDKVLIHAETSMLTAVP